jgi:hypothetical protein
MAAFMRRNVSRLTSRAQAARVFRRGWMGPRR